VWRRSEPDGRKRRGLRYLSFIDESDSRIANARTAFDGALIAATHDAGHGSVNDARACVEQWVQAVRNGFATLQAGDHAGAIIASVGPNCALRKTCEVSGPSAEPRHVVNAIARESARLALPVYRILAILHA
jgi:hypothetical protein